MLADAMTAHPEMVSGEGRSDLALTRAGRGDWVCKIGAEGVQAIGIRSRGWGIAIKVADGDRRGAAAGRRRGARRSSACSTPPARDALAPLARAARCATTAVSSPGRHAASLSWTKSAGRLDVRSPRALAE